MNRLNEKLDDEDLEESWPDPVIKNPNKKLLTAALVKGRKTLKNHVNKEGRAWDAETCEDVTARYEGTLEIPKDIVKGELEYGFFTSTH